MGTAHAIRLGAVGPAVCCTVHNDKPWHLMRQEYIKNGTKQPGMSIEANVFTL
jgi:hypothetical protein